MVQAGVSTKLSGAARLKGRGANFDRTGIFYPSITTRRGGEGGDGLLSPPLLLERSFLIILFIITEKNDFLVYPILALAANWFICPVVPEHVAVYDEKGKERITFVGPYTHMQDATLTCVATGGKQHVTAQFETSCFFRLIGIDLIQTILLYVRSISITFFPRSLPYIPPRFFTLYLVRHTWPRNREGFFLCRGISLGWPTFFKITFTTV